MMRIPQALQLWLIPALTLVLAVAAAWVLQKVLERAAERSTSPTKHLLVRHVRAPMRLILPLLAVVFVLPSLQLPPALLDPRALRESTGSMLWHQRERPQKTQDAGVHARLAALRSARLSLS